MQCFVSSFIEAFVLSPKINEEAGILFAYFKKKIYFYRHKT